MPLHVLQLGPYPPPEGGVSRNMLAIRDELVANGHRCSIVATSRSSMVKNEPDVYHTRSPLDLIGLLRKLHFDILHLHVGGDITTRVLGLAAVCSFFGRGRSVLTMHSGGFALSERAAAASPGSFAGRIFQRFSRVIAVNEKLAEVFNRFGVELIDVIPPHALKRPDPLIAVPEKLAAFLSGHSPTLIAVGGLERDYDPMLQIEAMREILDSLPDAGLMIVGGGSMENEVNAAMSESPCANAILLAGNVDHMITLHLMNDADIVLRTTLFDGDAISVREALFLGTPVIATDTGERPVGVELIKVGDKNGLIRKVLEVAKTERQKTFIQKSDISNIEDVIKLYEQLSLS